MPDAIRRNMELWIGCVAGALTDRDYLAKLEAAGFEGAAIEVTRVYGADDAKEFLAAQSADLQHLAREVDGKFVSGFVRAAKPSGSKAATTAATPVVSSATCGCAPGCCGS